MSSRKDLLGVSYHNDDDTGVYKVGEVDFMISGELEGYIRDYGREGLNEILLALDHLIWHVQEYGFRALAELGEKRLKEVLPKLSEDTPSI